MVEWWGVLVVWCGCGPRHTQDDPGAVVEAVVEAAALKPVDAPPRLLQPHKSDLRKVRLVFIELAIALKVLQLADGSVLHHHWR